MAKFFRQVTLNKKNNFNDELRKLSMDSVDDVWLIERLENVKVPLDSRAKDYLMLSRLVKPAKCKDLVIVDKIMTSEKIAEIQLNLESNVGNLATELYYEDPEADESEKALYYERIDDLIMSFFEEEINKGRHKYDVVDAFNKFKKYEDLQKKAVTRMINPEFITKTYS